MKPTHTSSRASIRYRRIGRKTLQADRVARALGTTTQPKQTSGKWYLPPIQPKLAVIICAVVIAVSALGFTGVQFYSRQATTTQNIAAAKQQSELEAKSLAANECRRKKAEQKADQIGKVTYDQLYDGNECDK